jgi:hypothetical protein
MGLVFRAVTGGEELGHLTPIRYSVEPQLQHNRHALTALHLSTNGTENGERRTEKGERRTEKIQSTENGKRKRKTEKPGPSTLNAQR